MMMTNEEAIEELKRIDADLLKTADCGNKASERMSAGRGRKAMRLAIKALENQAKYEKALERAVHDYVIILKKIDTDNEMPVEFLTADGVKYYKRKAGLEVSE